MRHETAVENKDTPKVCFFVSTVFFVLKNKEEFKQWQQQ